MTKFHDKKTYVVLLRQLKFQSIQIPQDDLRNTIFVFSRQSCNLFQQKKGVTVGGRLSNYGITERLMLYSYNLS